MSTKCTVRYGEKWHLYQEVMEDDAVYLELEDIEVQLNTCGINNNVIIRLDNSLALEIGIISEKEKPSKINWNNFEKNIKKFKKD